VANIFDVDAQLRQNVGLATSQTVTDIPLTGQIIYVQLWTQINGIWNSEPLHLHGRWHLSVGDRDTS